MQKKERKNCLCHLWVDGNAFYGLPICVIQSNACGRGVDITSVFILKNPDTRLLHLYGCLAIRYTTIPYQKSAQPQLFPRKVILVMFPVQHNALSSSVRPSVSCSFLCSVSSVERALLWGVCHLLGIYVTCQLSWDQNDISTLDYFQKDTSCNVVITIASES